MRLRKRRLSGTRWTTQASAERASGHREGKSLQTAHGCHGRAWTSGRQGGQQVATSKELNTKTHDVSGARETRRRCLARDERRHGLEESCNDSAGQTRREIDADRQQTMSQIINTKEVQGTDEQT